MALLREAKSIIDQCRDEEQDYFDNMPESFQDSEKGNRAEAAIDALEEAGNQLDEIEVALGDIAG